MRVDAGGGNVNDLQPNVFWRTTGVVRRPVAVSMI
jgi:hypothetical protein